MLTIAYLANEFPSQVEPYVSDEIEELRRRGVQVIDGSVRRASNFNGTPSDPQVLLLPLRPSVLVRGTWLCLQQWMQVAPLLLRILLRGKEGFLQRLKALGHTLLGACYAAMLQGRGIQHIHVHHGYIGSWIAMTASRLLGVEFGMTLHGSDVLLHGAYLDTKLKYCAFCRTISEYNRNYILHRYPDVPPGKIVVARLGVDVESNPPSSIRTGSNYPFTILAVGRLHPVKDHAFLVQACSQLRIHGLDFRCFIAGEGPERRHLQSLIKELGLEERVFLLGHVPRDEINPWYDRADLVVLTSRSEGIPLVLMEAMARGKLVLAPAITGIPELVVAGNSGFLYQPGSTREFVSQLLRLQRVTQQEKSGRPPAASSDTRRTVGQLNRVRQSAYAQVQQNFNRSKNLGAFADLFLQRVTPLPESVPDEDLVLQQI
jgi:glycosyltransferase involved in cell wall biosynthesis